jgi:hypothetical protein
LEDICCVAWIVSRRQCQRLRDVTRYAERLLRLQAELLRVFDRHRRGNQQTVEVRHMHLHPGSQGMIGIVNNQRREGDHEK